MEESLTAHPDLLIKMLLYELEVIMALKYNPGRHENPGQHSGPSGTHLDITAQEAEALLNDRVNCFQVPSKRQYVGVRNTKIYVFQDDNAGGFHGYPSTGADVCSKYTGVAPKIAHLLGVSFQRLSRMR